MRAGTGRLLMQGLRLRVKKASPSVSIFAPAPFCPNTCRPCRCKLCDVATDHDDDICHNCEQRQLFPERIPKWERSQTCPSVIHGASIAFLAVIGPCGGEGVLSGVRTVSLTVFHLVAGDGSRG